MKVFEIKGLRFLNPVLDNIRQVLSETLQGGPVEVVVQRPSKTRQQELKYHAMIGDIAKTVNLHPERAGHRYDMDCWKALLVDEFQQEMESKGTPLAHPGIPLISLDGQRAVYSRASTRQFRVKEGSDFIEFLYAKGTEYGARFSDKSHGYYEEARGES